MPMPMNKRQIIRSTQLLANPWARTGNTTNKFVAKMVPRRPRSWLTGSAAHALSSPKRAGAALITPTSQCRWAIPNSCGNERLAPLAPVLSQPLPWALANGRNMNGQRETYWIADPIETIVLVETFVSMIFKTRLSIKACTCHTYMHVYMIQGRFHLSVTRVTTCDSYSFEEMCLLVISRRSQRLSSLESSYIDSKSCGLCATIDAL